MKNTTGLILALLLGGLSAAQAQTLRPEPNVGAPLAGGLALGALGFLGGAVAGSRLTNDCSGDFCDLGGAAVGALIGEALGLAGGAHVGNRSRGSLPLDLLTATGMSALTIGAAGANENASGGVLLGGAIIQVIATVAMERGTGRARARRSMTVSLIPMPERRIGLSATIPLP